MGINDNWNLDPHESYLNQVPPGATQYPPDSMFAVGKPHGQAVEYHAPIKARKPRTLLDMVITYFWVLVSMFAAAFLYAEASERARKYNAIPLRCRGIEDIRIFHYPWSWEPIWLVRWNKFVWCLLAAFIPSFFFTFAFVLVVGSFTAYLFLIKATDSLGTMNDAEASFVLGILAHLCSYVLCFFYQLSKANEDTEEHWDELRKQAQKSPLQWVPITNHDAKLLGWKGLQEYREYCVRLTYGFSPVEESTEKWSERYNFLKRNIELAKNRGYAIDERSPFLCGYSIAQASAALYAGEWKSCDESLNCGYRAHLAENQPLPTLLQGIGILVRDFIHA